MRSALTTLFVALLVSAIGLSACGRKGPLERPPNAKVANAQTPEGANSSKPDRPFILDRLLR
ncbi:MAG: LPS translocon maturation chaperone LptM [Alphaproteobacteria bacterium]